MPANDSKDAFVAYNICMFIKCLKKDPENLTKNHSHKNLFFLPFSWLYLAKSFWRGLFSMFPQIIHVYTKMYGKSNSKFQHKNKFKFKHEVKNMQNFLSNLVNV